MKCAVIARHRGEYPVRLMCRVLDVSPAGFYAFQQRPESWRLAIDAVLREHIHRAFAASDGTYGAPRILMELRAAGVPTSTKRVARLMREDGLVARARRPRRVVTTMSQHGGPIAPNRLQRRFDVEDVAQDRVWVGDITYMPTREGFLYLAVVLDLSSRRCIGWAMRDTLEEELVTSALAMACEARKPSAGVIVHTDRGSQYASAAHRRVLKAHRMQASMSKKGDCWDNAVAESFFATMEFELVQQHDWHTRAVARRAIFRYIEVWYNRQRRHSTLGYLSPAEYEAQQAQAA